MLYSACIEVAQPEDTVAFIQLRGLTRENPVPESRLASLGITAHTWAERMRSGVLVGYTATLQDTLVGYCFGNTKTGEVVVLALLPEAEGQGTGRELLRRVVLSLCEHGHRRLFLGCSPDPQVRSYGFYRHLGWRSTGTIDIHGDEVLELKLGPGTTPSSPGYLYVRPR